MHLPRPDPKPIVVNEKRAIDFSGHYFKTHENNRTENSLLTPELFLRCSFQRQLIQSLLKSRRKQSAAPQYIGRGHSGTPLVNSSPMSALSASEAAGAETFLLFFCGITSQEQLLPQSLKNQSDAERRLAWMLAKVICQLHRRWNRVVGKISRPFKPINFFAWAELYYCPQELGAGTTRAHEWLTLLQLEISLILQEIKFTLNN